MNRNRGLAICIAFCIATVCLIVVNVVPTVVVLEGKEYWLFGWPIRFFDAPNVRYTWTGRWSPLGVAALLVLLTVCVAGAMWGLKALLVSSRCGEPRATKPAAAPPTSP